MPENVISLCHVSKYSAILGVEYQTVTSQKLKFVK